jgi:hypothetical protein
MRTLLLIALGAYLIIAAVRELQVQLSIQPRSLVAMAKSLKEPPPPGVMCASKPHFPRLLGMEFLPLRANWDLDSVRAHGADYVFLSPREMLTRPKMMQYTQGVDLPPFAQIISYWPTKETVMIEINRRDSTGVLTVDSVSP